MPIIVVKNTAKLIAGTLARLYNTCVMTHEHKVVHSQKTGKVIGHIAYLMEKLFDYTKLYVMVNHVYHQKQ